MRLNQRSFSKSFIQRIIVFLVLLIILNSTTAADDNYLSFRIHVSDPGQIPNFDNFDAPSIVPGSTGKVKFTITNRYNFAHMYNFTHSNNMTNVSLVLNIYRYVTLEESKDVNKISHGPKIVGGNAALREIRDQYTAEFYWPLLVYNQTEQIEISIKSSSDSPQGTFFVRMHLNFTFNHTYFDMKSRGHFTNTQWDKAQANASDLEVTEEKWNPIDYPFVHGRLRLDVLGVDGIIPDTSFRIKKPIPLWPFYLCVVLAISFLVLAYVFYQMDEKGKYPKTKKKLDDFGEKITRFRYRRE